MSQVKDYQVEAALKVWLNLPGAKQIGPGPKDARLMKDMRKALEDAYAAKEPGLCGHAPIVMICEFDGYTTRNRWCAKCGKHLPEAPQGAAQPKLYWRDHGTVSDERSGKDRRVGKELVRFFGFDGTAMFSHDGDVWKIARRKDHRRSASTGEK